MAVQPCSSVSCRYSLYRVKWTVGRSLDLWTPGVERRQLISGPAQFEEFLFFERVRNSSVGMNGVAMFHQHHRCRANARRPAESSGAKCVLFQVFVDQMLETIHGSHGYPKRNKSIQICHFDSIWFLWTCSQSDAVVQQDFFGRDNQRSFTPNISDDCLLLSAFAFCNWVPRSRFFLNPRHYAFESIWNIFQTHDAVTEIFRLNTYIPSEKQSGLRFSLLKPVVTDIAWRCLDRPKDTKKTRTGINSE